MPTFANAREQLEHLLDDAPIGMAVVRLDGRFLRTNRAFSEIVGYSGEELAGMTFQEITHPADLESDLQLWWRLLRSEIARYELEKRYIHKDGHQVNVLLHASIVRDASGVPLHAIAQVEDVTARKLLELDRERYFQVSLDMLVIASTEGTYRRLNPAWTETLGYTEAELKASPWIDFVHPEDRPAAIAEYRRVLGGQQSDNFEHRFLHKNGSYRWLQWKAVPFPTEQLIYASARDITERKRMQARLVLSDRMASLGTLAGGVAHEINNPLSYVISNLELAQEELAALSKDVPSARGRELHKILDSAREGAERVRNIVSSLRTFARPDQELPTPLELPPILELALHLTLGKLRHRAKIIVRYEATPRVAASGSLLAQVFINLLMNAVQCFTSDDPEKNEVSLSSFTDGAGRAVVRVSDNGPGIPEQILPKVFDPFFTTKSVGEGSGLGLFICHGIVSDLGGEISVDSSPGGTTVRVALPPAMPPNAELAPKPLSARPTRQRGHILIVDDEPAVRVALSRILSPEHHVEVAANGREALDKLSSGRHFDAILCDLLMPVMTGAELYQRVLEQTPAHAKRFIFLSGSSASARGSDAPPSSALQVDKPFDAKQIRVLVQAVVRDSRESAQD